MPKNVTAEQTERLLKLPSLMREVRRLLDHTERISLPTKRDMYEERVESIRETEELLSERKKAAAVAADELAVAAAKFEADKKLLEALTAELEELLKPYDEEIARHEEESRMLEEREFGKLNAVMFSQGWSTEECRRAAKHYVEDRVQSLGLETKKDIIARMRRGEDFPGEIPSFWG